MKRTKNEQRADRAFRLLLIAKQWGGDENADEETVVIDLLTDLMHYCKDYGFSVESCMRIATKHHEEEVAGEA